MKRAYLLGISHHVQDHYLQQHDPAVCRLEEDQKRRYGSLLEKIIANYRIQFIAEEASHDKKSVAQAVAETAAVLYRNVDLTTQERRGASIPERYETDRENLPAAERKRCDRIREEHWFDRAVSSVRDIENILFICGSEHIPSVAELFRAGGWDVTTDDLANYCWYVRDFRDTTSWPEDFK